MKKMYLMNGLAAMTFGLVVASCNKMDSIQAYQTSDEEAIDNAELRLGYEINPNHDWSMITQASASINVNGDYGTDNIVTIYQNNPAFEKNGVVLGRTTVKSGETANFDFTMPKATQVVYAAVKDYKGYRYIKPVAVKNDKVQATFGESATGHHAITRTATNANVNIPTIANPTAMTDEILAKSVEVNSTNASYNNFDYYDIQYSYPGGVQTTTFEGIVHNENYVVNFKISEGNTYTGTIAVLANAGLVAKEAVTDGSGYNSNWTGYSVKADTVARTVYVEGKWVIPAGEGGSQAVGQGIVAGSGKPWGCDGMVIVGPKGELEVNGTLNMNNLARLIILPGGKLTGTGLVNVNNGTITHDSSWKEIVENAPEDQSGVNYGTISVKQFNENYGTFFNYGTITSDVLQGGAKESTFVNHGTVKVGKACGNGDLAANLIIKNNCRFEVTGRLGFKIFQNGANAYAKAGSLQSSDAEGGENLTSYIALDEGSRFEITGNARLNNTSVIGPTSGDYAYVEFGNLDQYNRGTDYGTAACEHPIINNINLYVGGFTSDNEKNNLEFGFNEAGVTTGTHTGNDAGNLLTAAKAFNTAATEESDCAPAFTPGGDDGGDDDGGDDGGDDDGGDDDGGDDGDVYPIYSYAFEDTKICDYDMNDVVLKVQETADNKINLTLVASGATLDLNIRLYDYDATRTSTAANFYGDNYTTLQYNGKDEVHDMLGVARGTMTNTGIYTAKPITITIPKGSHKPEALRLAIYAPTKGTEMRLSHTGEPPYGIIVPGNWSWPCEFVNIKKAYGETSAAGSEADKSFENWSKKHNDGLEHAEDWYDYPTPAKGASMNESDLRY